MLPSHLYLGFPCDFLVRGFVSLLEFLIFTYFLCLYPRIFSVPFFSTPVIYVHRLGLQAKFLRHFYMTAVIISLLLVLGYCIGDAN
jgi:hypothetical protein